MILLLSNSSRMRESGELLSQPMRLEKALQQYRELVKMEQWPTIPVHILLQANDSNRYVLNLRHNLSLLGDLPQSEPASDPVFDEALSNAVKGFQRRHGLRVDGIAGRETLTELNVMPQQRIRQLEVNLKRWRAFNMDTAQALVLVNIPDFSLQYINFSEKKSWKTRVVVGKADKPFQTRPVESQIKYMVMNPSWNVPKSIIRREIIPILKRDKGYLKRNHMVLYQLQGNQIKPISAYAVNWQAADPDKDRLSIVQLPGPWNSLGKVKFLFSTPYSQYLHDTPAKPLFENPVRDFSHGCVRVQHPDTLAAYLLGDALVRKGGIEKLWATTPPNEAVLLPVPVQVKFGYFTCWVDDTGALQFRRDIYHLDGIANESLSLTTPDE